jgi:hypothetical protein
MLMNEKSDLKENRKILYKSTYDLLNKRVDELVCYVCTTCMSHRPVLLVHKCQSIGNNILISFWLKKISQH